MNDSYCEHEIALSTQSGTRQLHGTYISVVRTSAFLLEYTVGLCVSLHLSALLYCV